MRIRKTLRVGLLVPALCLSAEGRAAEPADLACSRVLPGPDFPRPILAPPGMELRLQARLDLDGDGAREPVGIAAVGRQGRGWIWELHRGQHQPGGGIAWAPPISLGVLQSSVRASALLAGDVDGDGRTDLVIFWRNNIGPGPHALDLLRGLGGGELAPLSRTTVRSRIPDAGPVLGDFDGDGRADVALITRYCDTYGPCPWSRVEIWGWDPRDSWDPRYIRRAGPSDRIPPVALDFDGDGIDDLLTVETGCRQHRRRRAAG